jgi:ubiquinone/menaquinone biosynthesis C-methylase UbiE
MPQERAEMRRALGADARVRLEAADAHALPYDDGSFDVLVSGNTGEHLRDFGLALHECRRVLREGGVARHSVDPWFGPYGGHALCTTDAPWGHVRLTGKQFAAYVRTHRPHEAEEAIARWHDGFQEPRLTLAQSRRAVEAAGFTVREWTVLPLPARSPHRAALTRAALRECRAVHPSVTRQDLLARGYTVLAQA